MGLKKWTISKSFSGIWSLQKRYNCWKNHKSGVITLVEVKSKLIFTLNLNGKTAKDIEAHLHEWLNHLPSNFIKAIIFDCGKISLIEKVSVMKIIFTYSL